MHRPPKLIRGAKTKEDTNKIIFLLRLMEIKMLRYTHKRDMEGDAQFGPEPKLH